MFVIVCKLILFLFSSPRFVTLLDDNSLPLIMFRLAARWAGVRLETLVTLVSTTTNVLVVLLHGHIPPPLAGLAIAYSVQVRTFNNIMFDDKLFLVIIQTSC